MAKLMSVSEDLLRRVDTASRQIERSSQAVLAKAFQGGLMDQA